MRRSLIAIAATSVAALATGSTPALAATHTKSFDVPVQIDPYQVRQEYTLVPSPKVDGFLTAMKIDVIDPDGSVVPIRRMMLHHIVFAALGKPNPLCQSFTGFDSRLFKYNLAQPFAGRGEENNVLVLPKGYGYRIGKNDLWAMVWMLMNHRGVSDKGLIRYTVTWDDATDLKPVTPYWLDVRNCRADPVFDVPGGGAKGSTYKQTYTQKMPESGRIVAGGGHVHGGAKNLVVSEPDCGNRTILKSQPAWGTRADPFYHVRPILHEPGPRAMSGMLSEKGYPIAKGQRIRLTANYDNHLPHTRVMGISVVYVAPQSVPAGCPAPPGDQLNIQPADILGIPYRKRTPKFTVPLTGLDANGKAHEIERPPGKTFDVPSGSTISVGSFFFNKANVAVTPGSRLNWSFGSSTLHNVTLANGPQGFSSPNLSDGRGFSFRFTRPGTYRIFCALHPVEMSETVTVRSGYH